MLPATGAAPRETDGPAHIVALGAVAAAGSETVIVTEFVAVHPVAVMVSVNV